jgi:AraC family transcriptional activator of mtrCDE
MSQIDWLSHLLQMITITGQLEVRCAYGAPCRAAWARSAANEIPYHVVLKGRAIIEDPETKARNALRIRSAARMRRWTLAQGRPFLRAELVRVWF